MALAAEAASAWVALDSGVGEVVATGATMERAEAGWEEEGCVRRRACWGGARAVANGAEGVPKSSEEAVRVRAAAERAEVAREGAAARAGAVVAVAMVKATGARARATKGTVGLNETTAAVRVVAVTVEGARVAASSEAALHRPDAEAAGGPAGAAR